MFAALSTMVAKTPTLGPLGPVAEAMYQFPSSAPPAGILLLAHGCSHSATDFFSSCSKCLGLPEEMRIVKAALARNYVALALSSSDRYSKCCKCTQPISSLAPNLPVLTLPTCGTLDLNPPPQGMPRPMGPWLGMLCRPSVALIPCPKLRCPWLPWAHRRAEPSFSCCPPL